MTEKDIFELMYEALGYADRNFEFWLSSSFAVILAFHFAGTNLSRLMYRMIMFLYISATILFVTRWFVAAMQYADFRQRLIEAGSTVQVSSMLGETIITLGYSSVIVAGSIGTVYYGVRAFRNASKGNSENT